MKAKFEGATCIIFIASVLLCIAFISAESAFAGNIDEGKTGTCKWELYNDEAGITTLKISAKDASVGGVMDDYKYDSALKDINAPWVKYRDQVDEIAFNNVLDIGTYSFYGFKGISKIDIRSVKKIGNHAFAWCSNVGGIYINGNNCVIGNDAFCGCENVTMKEVVLEGVKSIGETAFEEVDCYDLELGEGIESIGDGAFNNNEALEYLAIPESCSKVGRNAFMSCPKLQRVFIKNPSCILEEDSFDKKDAALFVKKNSTGEAYAEQYGFTYYIIGDNGEYTLDLSKGEVKFTTEDIYKSPDFLPLCTVEFMVVSKIVSNVPEGDSACLDINNDGKGDVFFSPGAGMTEVIMKEHPKRSIGGEVKILFPEEAEMYAEENGIPYYSTFVFKMNKADNPLYAKGKTARVKYSSLKKRSQVLKRSKVMTIKGNKGALAFKKLSGNGRITVNKKNGNVTVKKGLKKGSYKVTVKVRAAGNSNYNISSWKKVTIRINVK